MPFTNDLHTTLDTNKEQSGLQIDATTLAKYFDDKNQINKTASTWNESNKNQLGALESKDKESLKAAIDDYLRNHLTVKKPTGESCPAVEIISECETFADAIRKVKNSADADGKNINICAALLSLHSFLDGKGKLMYPDAQKYAILFCGSDKPNPDKPNPDKPNPDKPNPDKPNPDKPNPDKPNPDKPNPDKPNPDKPNPDKPNPDKPNPDKPNPDKPNPDKPNPDKPNPDQPNPDQPTIDPISETTPDNTNTTEAMDGVPSVITSGIDRVDNKERKDYLTQYVDKELNQVVNTYFAKDELGNNKKNENALIIGFLNQALSKDALMKEKGDNPEDKAGLLQDKSYEESVLYYQALLNELKNNPRMDGRKLVIPESATLSEDGKVTLIYADKVNAGIGRPNKKIEGKEKDRYMTALNKLTENTNFLIDNTKDKVYTLGLDKVDTDLPTEGEKKTVGQKNIDLAVQSEYYTAIQIEHNATNTKLQQLTTEYNATLGVIQTITSDIVAENKTLNNAQLKPEDKIKAQVKLVSLNQQLLEAELKLLTTGSLISTLAGEGTAGIQSKEQIITRMDKIKGDIKTNAEKMNVWISENEEPLKQLNNAEISTQIDTIKKSSTEEYVKSQEYIVESLKTVMNDSNTLFAKINKPYQESEKTIKIYEAQKSYWTATLQSLNPADPRYNSLKEKYESTIKGIDESILVEKDKQVILLKEFTDAAAKASTEKEKTLRSSLKNGEKLYMIQKESTDELTKIAQSGERSSTLSDKESLIVPDITAQTKDNQTMIDKKGQEVQKESTEYSAKLGTLQADIDRKEQEVKTELEKAANNQSYDLEKVTKNQLELLTHYQEKQEFLDKYNDTYYKDQQNYQRDFKNKLIGTTAHKEHTDQNMQRIERQLAEIDKDIASKKQLIADTEAKITELVKTATTDPVYQAYVNSEITRLTSLMNTTIVALTGNNELIDENNRKKTLDNFKNSDPDFALAGSLYDVRNTLEVSYLDEKDQARKWSQAEQFEQSRIDYIGTNAQTAIMKEKIKFYEEYNTILLTQISDYKKSIADNTNEIASKEKELKDVAGDTNKEKVLYADIAALTAENEKLTQLLEKFTSRQTKLQQALVSATNEYAKMIVNNDNAKKIMNTNEKTLVDNKTVLYKDESTTVYDAGTLDEERMKYKPYKAGQVSSETNNEEGAETAPTNKEFTDTDMKYINKVKEILQQKGGNVPESLPVFNTAEEAKDKFGILVIEKDGVKSKTVSQFDNTGTPIRPHYTVTDKGEAFYADVDSKNDEKISGSVSQSPEQAQSVSVDAKILEAQGCKLNVPAADLQKAISTLSPSAQQLFVTNPKEFWNVVWDGKGDKKFEGVYGSQTLQKIKADKTRIDTFSSNKVQATLVPGAIENTTEVKEEPKVVVAEVKEEPKVVVAEVKEEPKVVVTEVKEEPKVVVAEVKEEPKVVVAEVKEEPKVVVTEVKEEPKVVVESPATLARKSGDQALLDKKFDVALLHYQQAIVADNTLKDKIVNYLINSAAQQDESNMEYALAKEYVTIADTIDATERTKGLLAYYVNLIEATKAYIDVPNLETLTVDQAKVLIKQYQGQTLSLPKVSKVDKETMKILQKHKGDIELNGVRSISKLVLQEFIGHEGALSLNKVKSLSPEVAALLIKNKGALSLNALETIDDKDALQSLLEHKYPISLTSLQLKNIPLLWNLRNDLSKATHITLSSTQ